MLVWLTIPWFLWELKYVLFWLYLWQLKEYHFGRLRDHFSTHKGKKLIFSLEQEVKLLAFAILFLSSDSLSWLVYFLWFIYLTEFGLVLRALYNGSIKRPVITIKTVFLTLVSFALVVSFLAVIFSFDDLLQIKNLLAFDLLTPIIISLVVLFFQPFFIAIRNNALTDAREKLQKIRSVNNLTVVAITGSYGKTSTKEFLATMLSKKFKILATREHQNSEIGIARCILNELKPSHQIFIAEVGAYNKGKVKEVCRMLKPKIGVVTGVNEQHLSLFGSMKNLLLAEGGGELADVLKQEAGTLVVNGNNKYCTSLYRKFDGNKKLYSQSNKILDSDIWSDSITVHKDHISFLTINKSGEMSHFNVKVLGAQSAQNLSGATLVAKELGMSFEEISKACKDIKQEQAGMTLKQGNYGIEIIDSSYSANPDGVFADLNYLSIFPRKKVIVMPCLIELGNKSLEVHEKIGEKIAGVCDLAIITSKDRFKEIKNGAVRAGMSEKNILFCEHPEDICSIITLFCKQDDAVLLEGRVPKELINLLTK